MKRFRRSKAVVLVVIAMAVVAAIALVSPVYLVFQSRYVFIRLHPPTPPLYDAIVEQDLPAHEVAAMLDKASTLLGEKYQGMSPLHYAVTAGRADVIKVLLPRLRRAAIGGLPEFPPINASVLSI